MPPAPSLRRAPLRVVTLAGALAAAAALRGADPALAAELRAHVDELAGAIGPRGVHSSDSLARAVRYIGGELERAGWAVRRLAYPVSGVVCENLEVERRGTTRPGEIVVIGAHYDTVPLTPGADDNASGVAALLVLARDFARAAPERTLRFVAFANEEPAYFQTELMGSRVYARSCRARGDNIVAMVSLESIGYFSSEPGSQRYPSALLKLFFPWRGNFLAFVGNRASKRLVAQAAEAFRAVGTLPCETAALPENVAGIGWSDHWAFWQEGYPAIMVTDTAVFRNPHYHRKTDTPDTLDYQSFAAGVAGLRHVVAELARSPR